MFVRRCGDCLYAVSQVGLSPYALLVATARLNPQRGMWGDLTSWSGFLHHLRRADYGLLKGRFVWL